MLSCVRSLEGNQSVSTLVCEFAMIFSDWKVFNDLYQFSEMVIPWRQARDIYNGPVSYLSRHIFEGRTDCARFYDSIAWCQYSLMEILLGSQICHAPSSVPDLLPITLCGRTALHIVLKSQICFKKSPILCDIRDQL